MKSIFFTALTMFIAVAILLSGLAPDLRNMILFAFFVLTSIWAYFDMGDLLSSVPDKSALGVFERSPLITALGLCLLWWVAFPVYIMVTRQRLIRFRNSTG
jgi:hypothetical protein